MSEPKLQNNELVFLVPSTAEGKAILQGGVKVNFPGLNLAHAIRLLRLPAMEFSNTGGQSHGSGFTGSQPDFSPVVVQTHLDMSVPRAFQACVKGDNIGEIKIYQLVSSGANLVILSEYTLENSILVKQSIAFDAAIDQATGGDAIVATYVFMCTAITSTQTQFDEAGTAEGKVGTQIDRVKNTAKEVT